MKKNEKFFETIDKIFGVINKIFKVLLILLAIGTFCLLVVDLIVGYYAGVIITSIILYVCLSRIFPRLSIVNWLCLKYLELRYGRSKTKKESS